MLDREAVKLAQAGFEDLFEPSLLVWRSWRGGGDDNKDVCFVDKISNSAGHK